MKHRFDLGKRVAAGGMAEVFLGHTLGEAGFKKPVVIKRLHPHLAADTLAMTHFLNEAALASHLHHPNVVEVIDVGERDGACFLVMELIDGWDLSAILKACRAAQTSMPPVLAAYIAEQVLIGLTHAYRPAPGKPPLLAHRDVSPSNILISREGAVKVTDFGIAKIDFGSTGGTQHRTFKGTPQWAAPEAFRGEPITAAADQFALGLVLFEMLEGSHPFGAVDPLEAYMHRLMTNPVPPLTRAPPALATLVQHMLQKQPDARYPADGAALHDALVRYLVSTGEHAGPREVTAFLGTLTLPETLLQRAERLPEASGSDFDSADAVTHASDGYEDKELETGGGTLDLAYDPRTREPTATPAYEQPPLEGLKFVPSDSERSRLIPALLLLVLVGAGMTGAWLTRGKLWDLPATPSPAAAPATHSPTTEPPNPPPPKYEVSLVTEPPGASVRISGTVMGQTPFTAPNVWEGTVPLEFFLAGYESWEGKLLGGREVKISVTLKKESKKKKKH